jgi:hypothetical protein
LIILDVKKWVRKLIRKGGYILTAYLIIVFAIDLIATFIMGCKFLQLTKIKQGKPCKPALRLCVCLGATMGIPTWGYVIGFLIRAFMGAAFVASTISIFPCAVGMLHTYNILKKCDTEKCSTYNTPYSSGYCEK